MGLLTGAGWPQEPADDRAVRRGHIHVEAGLNYRPGRASSDVPLCPAALCQLSVDRGTVNLHAVHIDTHHSSRDIASVVDTLFLNNRFSAAELAIRAAHQQVPSALAPHQRHTAGTWKRDWRSV